MPVWRLKSGDPPAFLINQDRRGSVLHCSAQRRHQRTNLIGAFDVAGEKNETPWARVTEKSLLAR